MDWYSENKRDRTNTIGVEYSGRPGEAINQEYIR